MNIYHWVFLFTLVVAFGIEFHFWIRVFLKTAGLLKHENWLYWHFFCFGFNCTRIVSETLVLNWNLVDYGIAFASVFLISLRLRGKMMISQKLVLLFLGLFIAQNVPFIVTFKIGSTLLLYIVGCWWNLEFIYVAGRSQLALNVSTRPLEKQPYIFFIFLFALLLNIALFAKYFTIWSIFVDQKIIAVKAVVAQNARPSLAVLVDWYHVPGLVDHELIFLILVFDVFLVLALLVLLDGPEGGIEVGLEMGGARGVSWSGLRILVGKRLVGQDHGTSLMVF